MLDEKTVAAQLITPGGDSGYRDAAVTWAVFTIQPDSDTPVALGERQFPLAGANPADIPAAVTGPIAPSPSFSGNVEDKPYTIDFCPWVEAAIAKLAEMGIQEYQPQVD